MYIDDIEEINQWFDEHNENYGTYHNDDEYSICADDIEPFTDFLRDRFPDLVGVRCYIGKEDSAIWFFKKDLEDARFY